MVEESTPGSGGSQALFTLEEQEQATWAREAYQRGDYQDAANVLAQLKQKRPNDFRIKHNLALCVYALSGQTKTSDFQSKLAQLEADRKESKCSMITLKYNQAVILFHQQQFAKALELLKKLREVADDEDTELKVLALIAECYLNLRNPQSAIMTADLMQVKKETRWATIQQSVYARAYILSLCVGQTRPRTPSPETASASSLPSSGNLAKFIKAAFETRRHNCPEALKLLSTEQVEINANVQQTGESVRAMHYNNLAVIFFKMEKFTLSSLYLARAAQANDDDLQQLPRVDNQMNGRPLVTLGLSKKSQLLRNYGVVKLFAGQNKEAFELLIKSVDSHFDSSRAWLRIAEACIAHYCATAAPVGQSIISEIGEGCARLAIAESTIESDMPSSNDDVLNPSLSLEFAISCIENALVLLPKRPQTNEEDFVKLHQAILLAGAFTALKLKRFSKTAEYARKCCSLNSTSSNTLANLYLSEALIHLDMVSEAILVLERCSERVSPEECLSVRDRLEKSEYRARSVVLSNLAAAHATHGDRDKARKQFDQINEETMHSKTILLAVYICLKEGKRKEALHVLRTRSLSLFN